jgi:hypothetical protein
MPSLTIDYFKTHNIDYTQYTNFIETGTNYGDTILHMEPYFKHLYTIEIEKPIYDAAKEKYNGNKIDFLLGDSALMMNDLMPTITGNSIIFLDGHWSGSETGKGIKECPLYEELSAIHSYHEGEAIIIIDDARLFESNDYIDWTDITFERIKDNLTGRGESIYYLPSEIAENDRLVIHISKK